MKNVKNNFLKFNKIKMNNNNENQTLNKGIKNISYIDKTSNISSIEDLNKKFEKHNIWNFQNPKTNEIYKDYFIFKYFNDNYGYIINDQKTNTLIGIDFGDFESSKLAVEKIEKISNSKLKFIMTTHAHWDHSGGNAEWKKTLKNEITIFSGDTPECKVPSSDKFLKDNEEISFGNLSIKCLHTPGHIKSHVCFLLSDSLLPDEGLKFAFTGDTLFSAGCGRVFAGTHEEMFYSLIKLRSLDRKKTIVYCGHEYTLKNLEFALSLEPENEIVKGKILEVQKALEDGKPNVGSFIEDEVKFNPFLRCDEDFFKKKFNVEDPVEVFKIIRKMKDKF